MIRIEHPIRFIAFIGAIILIVAVAVLILTTSGGSIQKSGQFTIEPGQVPGTVWENLESEGYITKALPWKYHAWRQDAAAKIQAGTYLLEAGESPREVISRMVTGDTTPEELTITYPEGFTLEQIAQRTAERGIGTKEEFIAAASNPQAFAEQFPYLGRLPQGRTLEGYLFPDTYNIFPDDTPNDVIARMVGNFDQRLSEDLRTEAAANRRTIDQVVIMASIIEREVISDKDMALVSGVLWTRFDDGAGLGADATVRYVLDKPTGPLTVQDLDVDSPYNTRRYRGLPPGPISNPGLRALAAAARPQESDYYYYLSASDTGETIFSRTLEEHNANKQKHL